MPPALNNKPKFRVAFTAEDIQRLRANTAHRIEALKQESDFEEVIAQMQLELQLAKMASNIAGGAKLPDTKYVPESERKVDRPISIDSLGLSEEANESDTKSIVQGKSDKEVLASMTKEQQDKFWADKMAAEFPEDPENKPNLY